MKKLLISFFALSLSVSVLAQRESVRGRITFSTDCTFAQDFYLGNVSFVTDSTWTISGTTITGRNITQIWSDAVQTDSCSNKTSFDTRGWINDTTWTYSVDCRSNPNYKGDLFSWCAVSKFKDVLCPAPWRVPTSQDIIELEMLLTGQEERRVFGTSRRIRDSTILNLWSRAYGGNAIGSFGLGGLMSEPILYWSQSSWDERTAYYLMFNYSSVWSSYTVGLGPREKGYGFSLRCIRTPQWELTSRTEFGKVSFATDSTWTISGNGITQIWSDAVQADSCCNKTTFRGGGFDRNIDDLVFVADCRSNPDQKGDLFSWRAIIEQKDVFCSAPWRVPTKQDFIDLNTALGGNEFDTRNLILSNEKISDWSDEYADYGASIRLTGQIWRGFYWSQSEKDAHSGYYLSVEEKVEDEFEIEVFFPFTKGSALKLRCVRDN